MNVPLAAARAVAALAVLLAGIAKRTRTRRTVEADVEAGTAVEVRHSLGKVTVTGADTTRVTATARIVAADQNIARLVRLELRPEGNAVHVHVQVPRDGDHYPRHLSIALDVIVPRSTSVRVKLGMGEIAVRDVGSVEASARMGKLSLRGISGAVLSRLGMGQTSVELPDSWHGGQVDVRSRMGNVLLRVPSELRARYDVTASKGTVRAPASDPEGAPISVKATLGNVHVSAN